jgi:hypothetical protein
LDHEKIKRFVAEGKVEAVASMLANGCISLLIGTNFRRHYIKTQRYSESKISEKEIVPY